jgi:hypothetical protein
MAAMERAGASTGLIKRMQQEKGGGEEEATNAQGLSCPLLVDRACVLHADRPLRCRAGLDLTAQNSLRERIRKSSRCVFLALTGEFSPADGLRFSNFDTVSGRFVQKYFQGMMKNS